MGVNFDFALRDLLAEFVEANGYIIEPFFARKGGRCPRPPQSRPNPPEKKESPSRTFTRRKWEKMSTVKKKCKLNGTLTKMMLRCMAEQTPLLIEASWGKWTDFCEDCWYESRSICAKRWIDSRFLYAKCKIYLRWLLIRTGLATMPESGGNNGSIRSSVDLERQKAVHYAGSVTTQCSKVVRVQASASTSISAVSLTEEDGEDEMDARSSLTNRTFEWQVHQIEAKPTM
jgi:hypothetical protein